MQQKTKTFEPIEKTQTWVLDTYNTQSITIARLTASDGVAL